MEKKNKIEMIILFFIIMLTVLILLFFINPTSSEKFSPTEENLSLPIINGNSEFRNLTNNALKLLSDNSKEDFSYIQKYVKVIWNLKASGTNSPSGEISMSIKYARSEPLKYALTILHEACHIQVCRDGLFICVGSSREEEKYCLLREKEAINRLKKEISIPPNLEGYYQEENIEELLDTEWWKIGFSDRNY